MPRSSKPDPSSRALRRTSNWQQQCLGGMQLVLLSTCVQVDQHSSVIFVSSRPAPSCFYSCMSFNVQHFDSCRQPLPTSSVDNPGWKHGQMQQPEHDVCADNMVHLSQVKRTC